VGRAQGAQHNTFLRTGNPTLRALPQETHQKRRKYHFISLFSSLKRNGWAAYVTSTMDVHYIIHYYFKNSQNLFNNLLY